MIRSLEKKKIASYDVWPDLKEENFFDSKHFSEKILQLTLGRRVGLYTKNGPKKVGLYTRLRGAVRNPDRNRGTAVAVAAAVAVAVNDRLLVHVT